MQKIRTAVIQAGGKGTRLRALTKDHIPKPMLRIDGRPMLEWQIEALQKYDVEQVFIIIGYLGERIKGYFGDGSRFGIDIRYIEEVRPLGSAGALHELKDMDIGESFFLLFGDVMFDIDMGRMEQFHIEKQADATLLVHPNTHPYDSDLVVLDGEQRVVSILPKNDKREHWYDNCVNAGIYILSKALLKTMDGPERADLEKDLLLPSISSKRIFGYRTTEYVKDAGTVERFWEVEEAFRAQIPAKRNLSNRQKCIFLDRDGTINVYKGLLSLEKDLELEKGAAEAIRLINRSGYLAIVVSNQPVVARGMCSRKDVEEIHKKMMTLLGREGSYLDDILFCPHHPDKGYPGENVEYKKVCDCRKPATGMIDKMVERYNIDVDASYMIGDTTVDIQTGINAGLKTILVHTGEAGQDKKYDVQADLDVQDLLEAVKAILYGRKK